LLWTEWPESPGLRGRLHWNAQPRPQIRPSQLEKRGQERSSSEKRPGSEKRSKTAELVIHETIRIAPKESRRYPCSRDINPIRCKA